MTSPKRADLAAAFFETMCDDVRLTASNVFGTTKAKSIYFVGSFARENKLFREGMKKLPKHEVKVWKNLI